jgi:hypothetical protein
MGFHRTERQAQDTGGLRVSEVLPKAKRKRRPLIFR